MRAPMIIAGVVAVALVGVKLSGYFDNPVTLPVPAATENVAAQASSTATPARSAAKPIAGDQPKVDETALRYFARQGDQRRLEAEIARLRALYPSWTPPANPLEVQELGDTQLDAMWKLYAESKYAELRKAIADRQEADANWEAPDDLMQRLAVAESRIQLVNASDLKQYDAVIRIGAANASLLTCGDVDIMWRVAEAFAQTEKKDRARDAYIYLLRNCENTPERLATIQKALPLLPRPDIDQLLALERKLPDGEGEFEAIRLDVARQSIADADKDASLTVAPADLERVRKAAEEESLSADYLLLGWYYVRRDNPQEAQDWFQRAYDKDRSANAAQGLALALVNLDRPQEGEDILYSWRDTNDDTRNVYLAAVANLLALVPQPQLTPQVLDRMSRVVFSEKDAASAQQFGWYADGFNQFQTAERWFLTALSWKSDDEPSAYGLALMRWKLGNSAGVREVQTAWAGRSERIPTVGQPSIETAAVGRRQVETGMPAFTPPPPIGAPQVTSPRPDAPVAAAPVEQAPAQPRAAARQPAVVYAQETEALPVAPARRTPNSNARRAGCASTQDPQSLSPEQALNRGWCLMEANRPIEAAAAFEVGLRGSGQTRSDSAYGQSLAYLRAGLSDMAAVAASKAPINADRGVELRTALLEQQATNAFEHERYHETLQALEERARIAPERVNLMVLRGYAYLKLRRFGDAEQVFRAAASTGDRDALRGLSAVKDARRASP